MTGLLDFLRGRRIGEAAHTPSDDPSVHAIVRAVPAFASLSDALIDQLLAASQQAVYQHGAQIVRQGDPSFDALLVLDGSVEIVNENAHGKTLLARTPAPALLGEIGALANLGRTATIVADGEVRALRIPRDTLLAISRSAPDILVSVVGRLGQHIQGVNSALGLYAGSLAALEREDVDPDGLLQELQNPTAALRDFGAAFQRLARHISAERRKRKELASAALIQQAMLPQSLAGLDPKGRCSVEGAMHPARTVGGDFYDAFMLDDHHLALLIGDVCGKGVPAALFMSFCVTALRLVARQEADVTAVVQRANALLFEQNATSMFATVFYGVLDLETGRFDYCSCGHNPPVVVRRDGSTEMLGSGGLPLGIMPERKARAETLTLGAGDCLFLYTDGIPESHNQANEEFGEERLVASLKQGLGEAGRHVPGFVAEAVMAFCTGVEQFDDITALAVRMPIPAEPDVR